MDFDNPREVSVYHSNPYHYLILHRSISASSTPLSLFETIFVIQDITATSIAAAASAASAASATAASTAASTDASVVLLHAIYCEYQDPHYLMCLSGDTVNSLNSAVIYDSVSFFNID